LIAFINDLSLSFYDLAENKNLHFQFNSNREAFFSYFDHDKIERVVTNLLSNAFKFTPENGSILLSIQISDLPENPESKKPESEIRITVKDSGIGIHTDKINRIFDRFFQDEIPGSMINQGSGIGLSLVKEYLKVLNGDVRVESEQGKGSIFTIWFSLERFSEEVIRQNNAHSENTQNIRIFQQTDEVSRNAEIIYNQQKSTILLVEDNEDFRFYLKDNLRESFNVLEAANGKIGWQETLNHNPDLIVSDIMMPEMDGIELCKKLKSDPRSSHIPVILLTAKVSTDQHLEGIDTGADDYITKPFDFQILESRIRNLIQTREKLRKSYQSMIGLDPEKIKVDSLDEKFIRDALKAVQQNISNADFTVVELGQVLGMSRVSLYKKTLALTAKTPIEFIRIIRMKRAAQLLEESQLSVSEIAYEVGFNSPRIFSGYFKDEYKMLPSEYIAKNRKKKPEIDDRI
jgi:DNA-binding response OmpR family regulator/two-component sensor histidine kinase